MCIAIYKPEGVTIPLDHLVNGQKANPDGCGLAWLEAGEIKTFKSLDFAEFLDVYNSVLESCGNVDMLIHFRITSRGNTTLEMCHPFMVNDDYVIIHNGTMSKITAKECELGESDTSFFAREILANLPDGWMWNTSVTRLLEDYIGWSKVVVMSKDGDVQILNEGQGYWVDEIWYSNKTYEPTKSYGYYTGNQGHNWAHGMDDCDRCGKDFKYADLTYKQTWGWLCADCTTTVNAIVASAETHKSGLKLLEGGKGKATDDSQIVPQTIEVYRPCACCSYMVEKKDMTHVVVQFNKSLEEYPEQAWAFEEALCVSSEIMPDTISGWVCEPCFKWLFEEGIDDILSIEVIEYNFDPETDNIEEHDVVTKSL